jgi:CheY-like chemotaxis protein
MLLHPEQAQTVALLLHELATNAAKHGALSQEGGTLEVQWFAPSNGALELEWREHLDESQQPLGEPQRTGFGTTLLRRIVVDQLGGTVSRTFARNGLQCRLVIPFVSGSATHVAASPTVRSQQDDRKSVLIVEDEAILAMDIARLVEEMGFKVFATASTVEAALACLESQKPDFAMLDANLGGSPSTPVAERLVALEVPVIVATGYVRQPSEGLDSLARFPRLSKPVNDDALAKTISELGFPVKWR